MRFDQRSSLFGLLAFGAIACAHAQNDEIDQLKADLASLRQDYEARIQHLEQRLAAAEQAVPASAGSRSSTAAAFNPAIGIIFEGQAWQLDHAPDDYALPGFPLGGEAGSKPQGLGLGETEIDISANVDDKFTAWLTAPIAIEDGEAAIEIEEAWLETTRLPAGLSVRFGRFFSGIGYLNDKHAHAWDFADQPLPYQTLLGDQYLDDGVQLRWIPPTALFVELGAEMTRGARFPAAGAARSGAGARSVFVNVGGDVGASHSWLAGVSFLDAQADARPSGPEDRPLLFSGNSQTAIAEFVWKWAPNGNWRQRNLVLQAEFLANSESGEYRDGELPALLYDNDRDGWYLQGVYQPIPRWRVGARFDALASDDPGALFADTGLAPVRDEPRRYTIMADWSNSEFSRLRLQYSRAEIGALDDSQWGLQYLYSIGAHGAHTF